MRYKYSDPHLGEMIGRAEYRWKTGRNDWEVSFERAFNWLDQEGRLFRLSPGTAAVQSHHLFRFPQPGANRLHRKAQGPVGPIFTLSVKGTF